MTYQLLTNLAGTTSLVRTNADGSQTWIPQDPANSDYQTYLLTPVAVTPLTTAQQAEISAQKAQATAQANSTANLIQVGTPTPALATARNAGTFNMTNSTIVTALANMAAAGAPAAASGVLDSITLTAGTWVVTGFSIVDGAAVTLWLNTVSGTLSDSWPTQARTITTNYFYSKSAVIKVASTTTVYLNETDASAANSQGFMSATQIA